MGAYDRGYGRFCISQPRRVYFYLPVFFRAMKDAKASSFVGRAYCFRALRLTNFRDSQEYPTQTPFDVRFKTGISLSKISKLLLPTRLSNSSSGGAQRTSS
jgi:hypothetical protein